jgi:SNF family Na+-dependent transporter
LIFWGPSEIVPLGEEGGMAFVIPWVRFAVTLGITVTFDKVSRGKTFDKVIG